MPIEYETLRVIWWVLLGVLLAGFAVMDGFDLGVAMLLPWSARTDVQRRVVINTVGPVWEGNQVWIILGAGAIFAAWPAVYAVSFSGFYLAMLAVLGAFILRPVAFKYRSKLASAAWRSTWDYILCGSGMVISLILGVAIGNVLQGVPFHFDDTLRIFYTGTFWGLLNPFALFCGLVSVVMLLMHGGFYLSCKTEGEVQARSRCVARVAAAILVVLFALGGVWVSHLSGYQLAGVVDHGGPSNPIQKQVAIKTGAWMWNLVADYPRAVAPILGIAGALLALVFARVAKLAFVFSGLSVFSIVTTVGVSMFPFILPSSSHPNASLTVWDASSSQLTLLTMLIATCIFLPIILAYTAWVYRVMRGKVTEKMVQERQASMY